MADEHRYEQVGIGQDRSHPVQPSQRQVCSRQKVQRLLIDLRRWLGWQRGGDESLITLYLANILPSTHRNARLEFLFKGRVIQPVVHDPYSTKRAYSLTRTVCHLPGIHPSMSV